MGTVEVPPPIVRKPHMEFFILLALVVGGFFAFRYRVQLLSKILGQPESRIRAALEKRKRV